MLINKNLHYSIVGLGISGISTLEYLIKHDVINITATDIKNDQELQFLTNKYPQVKFFLGELFIPEETDFIILSPGIDQFIPVVQNAVLNGAILTNDINIFLRQLNMLKKIKNIKIVVITGTNGKTTVVHMLASIAEQLKLKYALCGNVGNPVLDYAPIDINDSNIASPDLYIIELSSFQLELVDELHCDIASILNITPDHLDRYPDFEAYCTAKLKVYEHAKCCVYYHEDLHTHPLNNKNKVFFTKNYNPDQASYSIDADDLWLMHGDLKLLPINELALTSEHNILNALAVIAIGDLLNFPRDSIYTALKNFKGLEYRYQTVGNFADQVLWINDSKGTNIGSTLAAINTTVHSKKYHDKNIIIILGGLNKNVDLSLLKPLVVTYCKMVILIGDTQQQLLNIFQDHLECHLTTDLCIAVNIAKQFAKVGDIVLFSPACASFDMFDNYKHRGEVFKQSVLSLYHEQC